MNPFGREGTEGVDKGRRIKWIMGVVKLHRRTTKALDNFIGTSLCAG